MFLVADITLLPALLGELISALPGIFRPAPTTTTISTGFVTGIITSGSAQIAATAALGTSSAVAASVSQVVPALAGSSSHASAAIAPSG